MKRETQIAIITVILSMGLYFLLTAMIWQTILWSFGYPILFEMKQTLGIILIIMLMPSSKGSLLEIKKKIVKFEKEVKKTTEARKNRESYKKDLSTEEIMDTIVETLKKEKKEKEEKEKDDK